MTDTPTLHLQPGKTGPTLDLERLIASRLLLQANSGGGKSWALRYILEGTHGRVQQIVLDPEGEFASLRERFDYVLAGKDGDVPAHPKTAAMLCRRVMELGVSAIIDLYDLSLADRREFVKRFLVELMHLPRALWHPTLIVVDEAHTFFPERGSGESQATEAGITLCTQGRKRGYAALFATQRLSKLHKDAAAELLNKMIGRTGLDVDVRRAGEELGFDKDARQRLKFLEPGQFFVYGPALANEVTLVRSGAVRTHHPKVGQSFAPPPPPAAKLRAALEQLAQIPKDAEEEARNVANLTRENARLANDLRRLERVKMMEKPVIDRSALDQAHASGFADGRNATITAILSTVMPILRQAEAISGALVEAIQSAKPEAKQLTNAPVPPRRETTTVRPMASERVGSNNGALPPGERAVLVAAASYRDGVDRDQLSVLTGYKRSSRDAYIARLIPRGYIDLDGKRIRATEQGLAALGADFEPLPTGHALQEYWLARLPEGERRVLQVVLTAYPDGVPRDEIDVETGYKRSSRDAYVARLKARRVVDIIGSRVRASDSLF